MKLYVLDTQMQSTNLYVKGKLTYYNGNINVAIQGRADTHILFYFTHSLSNTDIFPKGVSLISDLIIKTELGQQIDKLNAPISCHFSSLPLCCV